MAVSTLTCALPFFVSETYPLAEIFWFDIDAALATEFLKSVDEVADCFKQRREACRNEVVAKFDMVWMIVESDKILYNI